MSMGYRNLNRKKWMFAEGISLIEVIVAVGLVLFALTAVIRATTTSLKSSQFATEKAQSSTYAQQAIEYLRNASKADWTDFVSHVGSSCLPQGSWIDGHCGSTNIIDGKFLRDIQMDCHSCEVDGNARDDWVSVSVTVSWESGGQPHQSQIETDISRI